jgi:hypothetical protein
MYQSTSAVLLLLFTANSLTLLHAKKSNTSLLATIRQLSVLNFQRFAFHLSTLLLHRHQSGPEWTRTTDPCVISTVL